VSGDELVLFIEAKNQPLIPLPTSNTGEDFDHFHVWKLYSRYTDEASGDVYYLHPELVDAVDGVATTMLCPVCVGQIAKGEVPPNSVAGGKARLCLDSIVGLG
jgi:hypothetical protein